MTTPLVLNHRYRLDERLASGGMGEVWKATDELLGRSVAVKLLKEIYFSDESFRDRAAEQLVGGLPDLAHATGRQSLVEAVAVAEHEGGGHG